LQSFSGSASILAYCACGISERRGTEDFRVVFPYLCIRRVCVVSYSLYSWRCKSFAFHCSDGCVWQFCIKRTWWW